MKKQIFSLGLMLAAAFTLTNCVKEIDSPVQEPVAGYPFEIVANTVDTKTVNDGMSTKWASGDQINVFHALGDDTNYVNDGAFTVSDVEAGKFTGTIAEQLDSQEEYDWYVMYPYNNKVVTPGAQTAGYTYIGHSKGLNQTGYNSMSSLKDNVCPLYGVLKYGGTKPVVEMQHLSSIVAINVTNNTDDPLTISSAAFTATEDIVGSYYIDITKTPVEYTASGANYVNSTATVVVSEGTELAKGQSAVLYAAIKPFTATAGQKLTLSVNGYSKEITLANDVTFTAGKIKTVNFSYDKVAGSEPDAPDYSGEWLITGKVSNTVYAASAYESGNNIGVIVPIAIVDNTITEVDGLAACKMTFAKVTDGTYAGMYTIKDTKNQYLYAASSSSNQMKGKTSVDANCYWDVTLNANGTYTLVASKSANRNVMQFNIESKLFSCYATASQSAITLYPYSMVVPDLTPRIKVADVDADVASEGGSVTFTYTLMNLDGQTVSAVVSDSQMLSAVAADGTVTVTVSENEGDARSATITLSCGDAEPVVLTVNQLGVPVSGGDVVAGDAYAYTFTSSQFSANGTKTLGGLAWTIAGDGGYWGWDSNGKGQQLGSSGKPYTTLTISTNAYSGGVQEIVINASGASSTNAKLTVTVGGVQYGATKSLTSSSADYTFEAPEAGMQEGEIKFTFTQTSKKALYIKSISINN